MLFPIVQWMVGGSCVPYWAQWKLCFHRKVVEASGCWLVLSERTGSMDHKLDRVSLHSISLRWIWQRFCLRLAEGWHINENNNTKQTVSGQIFSLTRMYKLHSAAGLLFTPSSHPRCNVIYGLGAKTWIKCRMFSFHHFDLLNSTSVFLSTRSAPSTAGAFLERPANTYWIKYYLSRCFYFCFLYFFFISRRMFFIAERNWRKFFDGVFVITRNFVERLFLSSQDILSSIDYMRHGCVWTFPRYFFVLTRWSWSKYWISYDMSLSVSATVRLKIYDASIVEMELNDNNQIWNASWEEHCH